MSVLASTQNEDVSEHSQENLKISAMEQKKAFAKLCAEVKQKKIELEQIQQAIDDVKVSLSTPKTDPATTPIHEEIGVHTFAQTTHTDEPVAGSGSAEDLQDLATIEQLYREVTLERNNLKSELDESNRVRHELISKFQAINATTSTQISDLEAQLLTKTKYCENLYEEDTKKSEKIKAFERSIVTLSDQLRTEKATNSSLMAKSRQAEEINNELTDRINKLNATIEAGGPQGLQASESTVDSDELTALKTQLQTISEAYTKLKSDSKKLRHDANVSDQSKITAEAKLNECQQTVAQLTNELNDARLKVTAHNSKIDSLDTQIIQNQQEIDRLQRELQDTRDQYRNAITKAAFDEQAKNYTAAIAVIQTSLSEEQKKTACLPRLEAELEHLRVTKAKMTATIDTLNSSNATLKERLRAEENRLSTASRTNEKLLAENESLIKSKNSESAVYDTLLHQKTKLETELSNSINKSVHLMDLLKEKEAVIKSQITEIESLNLKIKSSSVLEDTLKSRIQLLEQSKTAVENTHDEIKSSYQSLQGRFNEVQSARDDSARIIESLHRRQRDHDDEMKQIMSAQDAAVNKIEQMSAELSTAYRTINDLEAELIRINDHLNLNMERVSALTQDLAGEHTRNAKITQEKSVASTQIANMQAEIMELKETKEALTKAKNELSEQIDLHKEQESRLTLEIIEGTKNIQKLTETYDAHHEQLEAGLKSTEERLDALLVEKDALTKQNEDNSSRIAALETQLKAALADGTGHQTALTAAIRDLNFERISNKEHIERVNKAVTDLRILESKVETEKRLVQSAKDEIRSRDEKIALLQEQSIASAKLAEEKSANLISKHGEAIQKYEDMIIDTTAQLELAATRNIQLEQDVKDALIHQDKLTVEIEELVALRQATGQTIQYLLIGAFFATAIAVIASQTELFTYFY